MIKGRTKQQVACDGIRTEWHSDAFTEILHRQVTMHFPMDGVIPTEIPRRKHAMTQLNEKERACERLQEVQEEASKRPVGKFLGGVMDGVRAPWKQVYKSA